MAIKVEPKTGGATPWLVMVALLVRLFVPANALDRFYNYDLNGGAAWMKIHPGSYLIFGLCLVILCRRKPSFRGPVRRTILALLGVVVGCGLSCVLRGATTALGLLVDNVLCAAAGLFCLSQLGRAGKRLVVCAILAGMTLNALMIFYELVSHAAVIKPPTTYSAYFFRPSGLLNHPLDNGLYLVAAIPAATLLRRPFYINMGLALIFLLATLAAGARLASIIAAPTLIVAGVLTARRAATTSPVRQRITLMLAITATIGLPLVLFIAAQSGLGYRFGGDLLDVSARTRWNVYALLAHLDGKSLLLGAGVDQMNLYASHLLNELVESPLVVAVFMFGLPLAIVYLGAMIYALYQGARLADLRVKVLAAAFVLVGAGNNVFVSKTSALLYALILVYGSLAFLPERAAAPRAMTDADRRKALYAARRWGTAFQGSRRLYPSPGARAFKENA